MWYTVAVNALKSLTLPTFPSKDRNSSNMILSDEKLLKASSILVFETLKHTVLTLKIYSVHQYIV